MVIVILDVRTPREFSAGHLEGAMNLSVESPDFEAQLSVLEKNLAYVAYCRSGYRSGVAIEAMKAAGFTGQLTNAGGILEASEALNLPIVA